MTNADENADDERSKTILNAGVWIDSQFLQEALRETLHESIKIVDYKVTVAVAAGDNYLSTLYRAAITYTCTKSPGQQQQHLIIKSVPLAKFLEGMLEDIGGFSKEVDMYSKVFPAMQRYLKLITPHSHFVAPDFYKCSRPNTLVLDDISFLGYKMADRIKQLDLAHIIMSLRTLARLHALSVKLYEDDPEIIENVVSTDVYREANRNTYGQFVMSTFSAIIEPMRKWGEDARFIQHVEEMKRCLWDKLMYITKPSNTFNVLNHGDLWINNILFKYDEEGKVVSARIIDYQMTRYASPACDLLYFLFTSARGDVLSAHMTDMLAAYHEALTADLASLGQQAHYTFEQLQEDMLDRVPMAIIAMVQILPLVVASANDTVDAAKVDITDTNSNPEHPMMKNFQNWRYKAVASLYWNHMESLGYLLAVRQQMRPLMLEWEAKGNKNNYGEEETSEESATNARQPSLLDKLLRILSQPICD